MSLQWMRELDATSHHLTRLGVLQPPTFLQRFACIDGRCRYAIYRGARQRPLACKQHRLPGGLVSSRNAGAVRRRLEHDAQRARSTFDCHQLLLCETHTQCAYLELCGAREPAVWEHFQRHLWAVPNTTLAWVRRNVDTGTITVVGHRGAVDAATLPARVDAAHLVPRLQAIGYPDEAVAATLAACLAGNAAYRVTATHCAEHEEAGVIVGTHLPGHRHFAVCNRMAADLDEALEVATGLLRQRRLPQRPFLLTAIARHPDKPHAAYHGVQRTLHQQAVRSLERIGRRDDFDLYHGTVTKDDGRLHWEIA